MKEYYIVFKRGKVQVYTREEKIKKETFDKLMKTHRKGDVRTRVINGWKITTYYFMHFNLEEVEIIEK